MITWMSSEKSVSQDKITIIYRYFPINSGKGVIIYETETTSRTVYKDEKVKTVF